MPGWYDLLLGGAPPAGVGPRDAKRALARALVGRFAGEERRPRRPRRTSIACSSSREVPRGRRGDRHRLRRRGRAPARGDRHRVRRLALGRPPRLAQGGVRLDGEPLGARRARPAVRAARRRGAAGRQAAFPAPAGRAVRVLTTVLRAPRAAAATFPRRCRRRSVRGPESLSGPDPCATLQSPLEERRRSPLRPGEHRSLKTQQHAHPAERPSVRPGSTCPDGLARREAAKSQAVQQYLVMEPASPLCTGGASCGSCRLSVTVLHGEFDPGSGRTLAACLTHASGATNRGLPRGRAANG